MRFPVIIPARGGSKGIPRKNLADFCGKPLLAWTILQARAAHSVEGIYVTTDDPEIAAVARTYGAEVIDRPKEISTDTASSESALLHTLDALRGRGIDPSYAIFLQATSPLREPADIDLAVSEILRTGADSLFSAGKLEDFCVWEEKDGTLRSVNYDYRSRGCRQNWERQWVENGSIYIFRPAILRENGNRLGGAITTSPMAFWKSFEVDDEEGMILCAQLFLANNLREKLAPIL